MTRTHLDLFTGLGGFSLAAATRGVQTVCQVEIDPHCRQFLEQAWPGVTKHDDIKTFSGAEYEGAIWLLTAGVPCQPASRAGKQGGSSDHRWLWPDALRVLKAIRPAWALFENPPGIGDIFEFGVHPQVEVETVAAFENGKLGNHQVSRAVGELESPFQRTGISAIHDALEQIEQEGYAVQVFSVPACAVNAPHRRERYWIVCRRLANSLRNGRADGGKPDGQATEGRAADDDGAKICMADSGGAGLEVRQSQPGNDGQEQPAAERSAVCGLGDTRQMHGLGGREMPENGNGPQGSSLAKFSSSCGMGDTEEIGGRPGLCDCEPRGQRRDIAANPGQWDSYVWLPCADGKVRRAPDDSIRVDHGLPVELLEELGTEGRQTPADCETHRSILAALGNSIVWQVASEIIGAMIQTEDEPKNSC